MIASSSAMSKGALKPIWKVVTLGRHEAAQQYHDALSSAGCGIGIRASEMLQMTDFSGSLSEVGLMSLTVEQMGLRQATYEDVCRRLVDLGYSLCPAEVAPALRLSFSDQPQAEWLRIAMRRFRLSDGSADYFTLISESDGLWLGGSHAQEDKLYEVQERFVCVYG